MNRALIMLDSVAPILTAYPSSVMQVRGCNVDSDQVLIKLLAEIGFCFGNRK